MMILISETDLIDFKNRLHSHYAAACNDYYDELLPFVDNNIRPKFEREVKKASETFQSKIKQPPTIVKI